MMNISYEIFAEDLEAIPKEEQAEWIKSVLEDKDMVPIFGRYLFPEMIRGEEDVPECHKMLCDVYGSDKDKAAIFPRSFAKTTWVKIDILHDIVYHHEEVIVFYGNSSMDAQMVLESVKFQLENNELLQEIYGNFVPDDSDLSKKWTNSHIQTTTMINVVAKGQGKGRGININNHRPTKIILDDIEDDEMIKNPMRRLKLERWINDVIIPSKDSVCGKIKWVGTVLSPKCELMKFFKKHGGIFAAALENDKGEPDFNGHSIWPAVWPIEKLMQRKNDIGSLSFSKEYMNNPVNEETSRIKREWLEKSYYSELPEIGKMRKVIMMDPQAGQTKNSNQFGLCVVGFIPRDKHRYLIESQTGRLSQLQQAALLVGAYQRHKEGCIAVGVEKVLNQVAVYQLILDWKAQKIDFDYETIKKFEINQNDRNIPFIAVSPKGKDKMAHMQMHEASIERGEVHLHITHKPLTDKLVAFTGEDGGDDDDIDALLYCLDESNKNNFTESKEAEYTEEVNQERETILGNIMQQKF